jgi:hypothetical protein
MNELMKTTFQIIFVMIIGFIVGLTLRIPERLDKEISRVLQTKNKKKIQRVQ